MQLKKIMVTFKSGYITPLESDTLLWYVFAKSFEQLEPLFEKFEKGNPSFLFSTGLREGIIPRPFMKTKETTKESLSLQKDLEKEVNKKKIKKTEWIKMECELFEKLMEWNPLEGEDLEKEKGSLNEIKTSVMKNSIPRFWSGETSPYGIEDVTYSQNGYAFFVKIEDEEDFQKFFKEMQNILLTIGWGKGVSRGFGKISQCECVDLSDEEKKFFEYREKIRAQKNTYFVMNNYKPKEKELEMIDFEKSYLQYLNKNTKTMGENVFKGNMKFIAPGSVIVFKESIEGVLWSYYQVEHSFNFWYLF